MTKKKITTLLLLIVTAVLFAQVRNYDDTAVLFSQDNIKGTARYTAMSGAFGALGGNLSAGDINPAGMAIFNDSEIAFSFQNITKEITTDFYNTKNTDTTNDLNFSQGGGVLIFTNDNEHWQKYAASINITSLYNFDSDYTLNGNSNFSNETYFHTPMLNGDLYDNVSNQKMKNNTYGGKSKITIALASQYDKNTYFGISLLSKSIEYTQEVDLFENSTDINNNTFNASQNQTLNVFGDGYAFNFGILKKIKNIRLGLAYQTPTWYSLTEDFTEDTLITLSNNIDENDSYESSFEYQLKTPSKLTGSLAYVFGKKGLISMDYIYSNPSKTNLEPNTDFTTENQFFKDNLAAVSQIRIGAEYRMDRLSLRGGFHSKNNSYKNNTNQENGYSFGLGYKIKNNTSIDISYALNGPKKGTYKYLSSPTSATIAEKNNSLNLSLSIGL